MQICFLSILVPFLSKSEKHWGVENQKPMIGVGSLAATESWACNYGICSNLVNNKDVLVLFEPIPVYFWGYKQIKRYKFRENAQEYSHNLINIFMNEDIHRIKWIQVSI